MGSLSSTFSELRGRGLAVPSSFPSRHPVRSPGTQSVLVKCRQEKGENPRGRQGWRHSTVTRGGQTARESAGRCPGAPAAEPWPRRSASPPPLLRPPEACLVAGRALLPPWGPTGEGALQGWRPQHSHWAPGLLCPKVQGTETLPCLWKHLSTRHPAPGTSEWHSQRALMMNADVQFKTQAQKITGKEVESGDNAPSAGTHSQGTQALTSLFSGAWEDGKNFLEDTEISSHQPKGNLNGGYFIHGSWDDMS